MATMDIRNSNTHWCLVVPLLLSHAVTAVAQTKIQCQLNQTNGNYEAPLAWQNTLGASRANAMCSSAAQSVATKQTTLPGRNQPSPQPQAYPEFLIADGERASQVMRNWVSKQGYSLVWDAPAQSDLIMSKGQIDAVDLTDALKKLLAGLNEKVVAKRSSNTPDSQFAFPVEATAYSNKVIAITVKQ